MKLEGVCVVSIGKKYSKKKLKNSKKFKTKTENT